MEEIFFQFYLIASYYELLILKYYIYIVKQEDTWNSEVYIRLFDLKEKFSWMKYKVCGKKVFSSMTLLQTVTI